MKETNNTKKKRKIKPLFVGLTIVFVIVFSLLADWQYLNNGAIQHRVVANITDTYLGYFFQIILFLFSVSMIMYGLNWNNKLTNVGKSFYEFVVEIWYYLTGKKNK